MKITKIKKKLLISSIAFAMVTTSTLFSIHRVHGESDTTAVLKTGSGTITPVKAILTNTNQVMQRGDNNISNGTEINDLTTVTDLLIDTDVTTIVANKFKDKVNLTKLTFKEADNADDSLASKVTSIGNNAFKGTRITNVVLPKNLITIGVNAFADTTALITVDFKNTKKLTTIEKWAFAKSGLTSLDLSPMNTGSQDNLSIGEGAFQKSPALASVILSTKINELKLKTFGSTAITAVEIVQGIATIHPFTFQETPLATLTVNEQNTTFAAEANVLYNKDKTTLYLYPEGITETEFTIPDTVTTIEGQVFNKTPLLTNVVVGAALTDINQETFAEAKKLITLDLRKAKAIASIGDRAFNNSPLNSMIISNETGPLTTIGTNTFNSTATTKTVTFKNIDNSPIIGADKTKLVKKYEKLKAPANGTWKLDSKFATPTATANYETMRLTGFVPEATYTIQDEEFPADENGSLKLLKKWSGKTLSIVRKATSDQEKSDPQELKIEEIFSVYIDEIEKDWKIKDAIVSVTAPEKKGHQLTGWQSPGVTSPTISGNKISFTMPGKDVRLTTEYTAITVETPEANLIFDGKKDVPVTIVSTSSNFDKLKVKDTELTRDKDYTVTGTDKTTITLKKEYLDTLTETTTFEVTFKEGGTITFILDLYGPAPVAVPNYKEMKLTKLEVNTQYKINATVMTSDAQGTIKIDRTWGGQTLEIIKAATDTETDSKPQNLDIKTFYTISVDGKELGYTVDGMSVTLKAEGKEGYNFKEWTAVGVELTDASKADVTFTMPASNVVLTTIYTSIITTKPEEMVYNGKNEVIIRFDVPMADFKDIEYNGKKLVKNVDYIVTSGSTIITFTKTFLDKINGDINGLKAVFTNNAVSFTIKHQIAPPIVDPGTPQVQPAPVKPVVTLSTKSPNTGDTTNMSLLFAMMLICVGIFAVMNRKKYIKHKE